MPEHNASDLVTTVSFKASMTSEQTTDANGKKVEGPKYSYKAEITYASVKDAVEKAAKFTTWTLQRLAREGKLPINELVTVNGDGEYKRPLTFDEVKNSVDLMSEAEEEKLLADLLARKKAKA